MAEDASAVSPVQSDERPVFSREHWSESLRTHGLRVTKQRLFALDVIGREPHITAERVHELGKSEGSNLTLQTVYGILTDLTGAGILRRFDPPRSPARYELAVDDNHHHLVCDVCGRIVDVACAVGEAPCLQPSETHGFQVHVAELTFRGTCAECAQAGAVAAAAN